MICARRNANCERYRGRSRENQFDYLTSRVPNLSTGHYCVLQESSKLKFID